MAIFETFSKRQKRLERAGKQDVYQYDRLPNEFRVQVVHIWVSAMGRTNYGHEPESQANGLWTYIHKTLCREKGVFALGDGRSDPYTQCIQYLTNAQTLEALDIIELSFRVIDRTVRKMHSFQIESSGIAQTPDSAIQELNHRFQEHGIGYQYVEGELVRVDSQFIHAEAVKPALSLLHESGFDGPADEFMRAFDHYRNGRKKEAVSEALKSLESTMKAICKARKWSHPPNATAKPLMDLLFDKKLIPPELESQFSALRSAMESGLPTIANRNSRHGQGAELKDIPDYFASYALHLAASNIVFLVKAHRANK